MALNALQLANLTSGEDDPTAPKPKRLNHATDTGPGLTGADLELAHAERDQDAAGKRASTNASQALRQGIRPAGHSITSGYTGSPEAMGSLQRNLDANHDQDQAWMDADNIRSMIALLHAHHASKR